MIKDDASRIADQWNKKPSSTIKQRSKEALENDGHGSGALLGLEPATTENKQENAAQIEQNDPVEAIFPLLGTNSLASLHKSSQTRSSERVCYDSLLRFGAHSSDLSIRKTVRNGPRGCYGFN